MIKLPLTPFNNIAISLSGGGFRATAFHLGTLSYMSQKKWNDETLLKRVRILSTVSGGTFTGIKYTTSLKKGRTFEDCYTDLYEFMAKSDLVGQALEYLGDDNNWSTGRQRSLINSFASVYHKEFESEHFDLLWKEEPKIHLKEISFNATEFNFAIPFRFQKTEKSNDGKGNYIYGYIGNNKIRLPIEVAKEFRLSDITAASSCFPLGFEPINFPDDFIHNEQDKLKDKKLLPTNVYDGDPINYPVGIMDGGIDDNQGIDAVVWAEKRMAGYPEDLKDLCSKDEKVIDLFIVSDVSSPYMESFIRSETTKIPVIGEWKFKTLKRIGLVSLLLGIGCFIFSYFLTNKSFLISLCVLGTIGLLLGIIFIIISKGISGLTKKLGVPGFFVTRLKSFDKLNFNTVLNLVTNRSKSAMTLVSDVFMKQIRRFSYSKVYNDDMWKPRLIMNAVYELTSVDVEKRKANYPFLSAEIKQPSEKLMDVSLKAKNMGTTLWFTPEELVGEENMLNTLIACGQYTICFNLLEYIEKWLKNPKYKTDFDTYNKEIKTEINTLYQSLIEDWQKFQIDPFWMTKELNEKLILKM